MTGPRLLSFQSSSNVGCPESHKSASQQQPEPSPWPPRPPTGFGQCLIIADSEVKLLCVPAVSNSGVYRRLQHCRTLESHLTVQNHCYLHTQCQAQLYNLLKEAFMLLRQRVRLAALQGHKHCYTISQSSVQFVYISKSFKLSNWQNAGSSTRVCGLAWDQISDVQSRSQTSLGFMPRTLWPRFPDCIKTLWCRISAIKSTKHPQKRKLHCTDHEKTIHHIVGDQDVHPNIDNNGQIPF